MTIRTGRCMCGKISFVARDVPARYGIFHCEMCRPWAGSALLGVSVPGDRISWNGQGHTRTRQSSEWAERAWCGNCGSGLYYRVTEENGWFGATEIPIGLFDEPNGFALDNEIYIDLKPDSHACVGEGHKHPTRQDCIEKFSRLGETGNG